MVTGFVHSCAISTPRRAYSPATIELTVHIAISAPPGTTHFHLSQVKHLRAKCLPQGHNIETMSQDCEEKNIIFPRKSCAKRGSKPHGRQRHCQSAKL